MEDGVAFLDAMPRSGDARECVSDKKIGPLDFASRPIFL
jgi:hypothetical protein